MKTPPIKVFLLLLFSLSLLFFSCDKNDDKDKEPPTVITADVTNISAQTATGGGNVTDDGGVTITARGVCWTNAAAGNPTISDNHTTETGGTGVFTTGITGLSPSTTYYVKAYATNGEGTSYGLEVTFTSSL